MTLLCPDGISIHYARLGGYDVDEIPDSEQMAGLGASDMAEPIHLLLGVKPDLIMYGCTSATLTHGPSFDRELAAQIKQQSGAETVTAAGALVHALKAINAIKIAFASPYVHEINEAAISFLGDYGIETVSRAGVAEALDNYGQGSMTPDKVFDLGLQADSAEAEALVLSCTDMRAVEIIEKLEQKIGKPVISSNQAMMFEALSKLGIETFPTGFGKLFDELDKS